MPDMLTSRAFTWFVLALFAGMLMFVRFGQGIAAWQRIHRPDVIRGATGAVEGAVLGLMGLLLAFTFSGAAFRFDMRRSLIADEANAIGTAYLRLDLLPPDTQPQLRRNFVRYVHSRLAVYRKIPNDKAVKAELMKSKAIQSEIWKQAVVATKEAGPAQATLMLSALNQMIDITTTRTIALHSHPPRVIFVMLGVTVLASSLMVGYSMSMTGRPSLIHIAVFTILVGISVYVILDFEYPRIGFIRLDPFDEVLIETIEGIQ